MQLKEDRLIWEQYEGQGSYGGERPDEDLVLGPILVDQAHAAVGVVDDGREGLVHLVRDPRGHLGERGEPPDLGQGVLMVDLSDLGREGAALVAEEEVQPGEVAAALDEQRIHGEL